MLAGPNARVRRKLFDMRVAALRRIPPRSRGRVASLVRLAPPEMRRGSSYDSTWWDSFYEPVDPFRFDSNPREALKYECTLELCGEGPFERVLEIGCAEGAFTELLAHRCRELLAVDISEVAVARAATRTSGFPGVRCEQKTLPRDFPEGPFDLIVASDVMYYWQLADLEEAIPTIGDAVAPGGRLVVAHYAPPMGAILDGDEVHDVLTGQMTLSHVHSEATVLGSEPYRFDVFEHVGRSRAVALTGAIPAT